LTSMLKNLNIQKTYSATWGILKNSRIIFYPFIVFSVFELICLIIIYIAPRMPFVILFGPIIRTLWNEVYLHYPMNFILLPKLFVYGKIVLSTLIGSLLTGLAVFITLDIRNKKKIDLRNAFLRALKLYVSFFIVILTLSVFFYGLDRIFAFLLAKYFALGHTKLLWIGANLWMGPILFVFSFILSVLAQSIFIYAIPILANENEKLLKAMGRSLVMFVKNFIPTVILVGLPALIYIPILLLHYKSAFLMQKFFPEIMFWITFASIPINTLIVDPLVTVSTTLFYLNKKQ
jgi:hypothetical protein